MNRGPTMAVEYQEQVKRLVLDEQVFVRFTMKSRYPDAGTPWPYSGRACSAISMTSATPEMGRRLGGLRDG